MKKFHEETVKRILSVLILILCLMIITYLAASAKKTGVSVSINTDNRTKSVYADYDPEMTYEIPYDMDLPRRSYEKGYLRYLKAVAADTWEDNWNYHLWYDYYRPDTCHITHPTDPETEDLQKSAASDYHAWFLYQNMMNDVFGGMDLY